LERVLVLTPRCSDAGTIAASSEVSGLPAANLQNMQPAKKWRSNGATAATLSLTLSSPLAANALALVAHNLSSMGVIRVRGATVLANITAAPDVDSGWQSAWPAGGKPTVPLWANFTSLVRWTAGAECLYWQIDIADPGALSYLEAGRLALGVAWQPSLNFDIGGTPLGFDPVDVQSKTNYGRTFTDSRGVAPRLFELAFYALDRREAFDGLYEIQRLRGMSGDLIVCLDPGEVTDFHRFTMQGVFADRAAYALPPAFNANGNMFGAGIRLRELL
jgi:hypothetical protein